MRGPTIHEALARVSYSKRTLYNKFKGYPVPIGGWIRGERLSVKAVEIIFQGKDWRDMPVLRAQPISVPAVVKESVQSQLLAAHSKYVVDAEQDIVLDEIQARLTQIDTRSSNTLSLHEQMLHEQQEMAAHLQALLHFATGMSEFAQSLLNSVSALEARAEDAERCIAALRTRKPEGSVVRVVRSVRERFSMGGVVAPVTEVYEGNRLIGR